MDFKCDKCGDVVTYSKVRFSAGERGITPNINTQCDKCKEGILHLVQDEAMPDTVSFTPGRFKSMSPADKKAALKKRSRMHFLKHDKKAVEQKRHDTINHIKEQFERGINK